MTGRPPFAAIVNGVTLVADPEGEMTAIGPVVAPAGTLATICVSVSLSIDAAAPLNVTTFWPAPPNPPPTIATLSPGAPADGGRPTDVPRTLYPPGRSEPML